MGKEIFALSGKNTWKIHLPGRCCRRCLCAILCAVLDPVAHTSAFGRQCSRPRVQRAVVRRRPPSRAPVVRPRHPSHAPRRPLQPGSRDIWPTVGFPWYEPTPAPARPTGSRVPAPTSISPGVRTKRPSAQRTLYASHGQPAARAHMYSSTLSGACTRRPAPRAAVPPRPLQRSSRRRPALAAPEQTLAPTGTCSPWPKPAARRTRGSP